MSTKALRIVLIFVTFALSLGPAALLLNAAEDPAAGGKTQLDPGEQDWYTLSYAGDNTTVEIRMDVDPDGGASFMIVTADAVRAWEAGEKLEVTGRGAKNSYEAADLFWSGSSGQAGDYHLVVEYSGNGKDPSFYSLDVSGAEVSSDAVGAEEETAATGEAAVAEEAEPTTTALSTASAVSMLSNQPGRAIVTARGNHFVVDSVPPLGGPNEEINPLDLMLGALATCGTFVYETAAEEMDIPLTEIAATVEGDFNAAGVKDGSVNPKIQALRVHMDLTGASDEQAEKLAQEFQARCPIYTTLSRSAPIEISTGEKPEASVAEGLATASVVSRLSNQPGRAIVTARGNHFVVDSVPPLGGPNEERNPLDLALGALATCGTFIYETAAEEMDIPLTEISTKVEGDLNAAGVKDGSVNPRIQAFRVEMELAGATADQAKALTQEFQNRCPIYTTLIDSASIDVQNVIQ